MTAASGNNSATRRLTAAQRDAIERIDLSLAVTSGAGCGKTFVLARRYLRRLHADGRPDAPAHVVAVTFTEKAAIEMRQRVAALLGEELAACQDTTQRSLLGEWLRRMSIARISTIHTFCAALLRTHAVAAGVDPDFAVLADEFQADQMAFRAIREALLAALAGSSAHATNLLESLPFRRVEQMVEWLLRERWRWSAAEYADPAATLARWQRELKAIQQLAWSELDVDAIRTQMRALAELSCDDPADKLAIHRDNQLASLALLLDDPDSRTTQRFADLNARPGSIGSPKAWGGRDAVTNVRRRLSSLIGQVEALGVLANPSNELDRKAAELLASLTALADDAVKRFAAVKRRAGWLDFVDLLVLTRDLLRDQPDIRRRVCDDIVHLLIDEFQDTDSLQRELLWLACGCDGWTPPPGRLFFVGDAQQSIYRFRGAEVEVFRAAREAMGEACGRRLDLNFRTHAPGIALVNALFSRLLGSDHEPLSAHRAERPPHPAAEVLLAECPEEKPDADDRTRHTANLLAERIGEILRDGQPRVWDRAAGTWRPARPGDVAVLFRRLTNTAPYEEALADADVPFYVVAGGGLYRQQEVYDLTNALRAIDNPLDDVAVMGFLRGGMVALDDNALLHLANTLGPPYHQRIIDFAQDGPAAQQLTAVLPAHACECLCYAGDLLRRLSASKDALGLDGLIEALLGETHFEAALLAQRYGQRKCGNVHRVLELARSAQASGATLRQFVEHLSTLTFEQVRAEQAAVEAEEDDVVRLMTVHKAKGLEFPIVFLADLNYVTRDAPETLNNDAQLGLTLRLEPTDEDPLPQSATAAAWRGRRLELAEDLRTLYVAVTRHCDYIGFVGALEQTQDGALGRANSDLRRLDEALELAANLAAGQVELDDQTSITLAMRKPQRLRGRAKQSKLDALSAQAHAPSELADLLTAVAADGRVSASPQEQLPFLAPAETPAIELAPTALSELEMCPAHFRWHYELRVPTALIDEVAKGFRVAGIAPASDLQHESTETPATQLDAATAGTIFHRCMELLDFARPQSAERLVRQALAEEQLEIDPAELTAQLQAMLDRFSEKALWSSLAGARRRLTEVEFVTRVGRLELNGKIDLLYQEAEGAWRIVDYKSDRLGEAPTAAELAAHAARYELQMGIYSLAAARFLETDQPVPATLYFLRPAMAFDLAASASAGDLEQRLGRLADVLATCRQSGRWPAQPSSACRHCHYAVLCQAAR